MKTTLLAFALTLATTTADARPSQRPAARVAAPPTIQLVETRPVETTLGDSTLPAAADVWVAMIDSARTSLDLEQFYISTWPGEKLEPVLAALGRAAARGVRVRVLIDARMHTTFPQPADSLDRLAHVAVRTLSMGALGGVQHAKFFLVDGARFFLGSQNFDWRALTHIHELGVRVDDPQLAAQLQRVFDDDWARSGALRTGQTVAGAAARPPQRYGFAPRAGRDGDRFTLSASPRAWLGDSLEWDRDAIARVLDGATRTIRVQLLSYSPSGWGSHDAAIHDALLRAARRGIEVQLLVSEWETGDREGMKALTELAREPHASVKLSTLPRWSGGYIPFARVEHCKYLVADDRVLWLGTSNWEPSYFHTSRNVGLTCESAALATQAAGIFATSWSAPSAAAFDPARTYTPQGHGPSSPDGSPVYGK